MDLLTNFWLLFVTAAPWLLLGFGIAGLIHVFIPEDVMSKHLGAEGLRTTVKAAFIGAPLPLCSCGVIPAALGLRRSGASKSATVSFLVATPETGVDSVALSYAMLGPVMAVIRPIAAICSAIVAGVLVGREQPDSSQTVSEAAAAPCCSAEPVAATVDAIDCCSSDVVSEQSLGGKLLLALDFSTGKLIADTAQWLVVGLFFAALVQTFVSADFLASHGEGIVAMTVMVLVSIPMYICATASTPIAAGLLFAGVSPGAILVFMLAGPATNIATLGVVGKELGRRSLVAYLFGVIATAMVFGAGLDLGLQYFDIDIREGLEQHVHLVPEVVGLSLALILAVLLLRAFFNQSKERFFTTAAELDADQKHLP